MDSRGGLGQVAASLPQTARSDALRLDKLLNLIELVVEDIPGIRNLVAAGIATFATSQFVLEGKVIQSAVFAASLKRCGLLWKLLLKELEALSCPQRLLLKLQYCQRFCIRTFNTCPLDTKRSMVSDNAASLAFALELSVAITQGFLPTELNEMAATMISFFQQFQQYIPCDTAPLHPSHCEEVLAKLIVISNKHQETALELVMTTVLHSVSYYGWHATIGNTDIETLLLGAVHSQSEKLSITSKALLAYLPGTFGVEVLLDREQLSLIVRQLSIASATSESTAKEYSVREILTIIKAVIRVPDNCTGLLEQGLEETLDALMEQANETANAVAAEITWRIAAASGGADAEDELMEGSMTERTLDSKWAYASPQAKDPDGTVVFTDILLQHLAKLVFEKSPDDLSAAEALTMETLVYTVFDIYWQSEAKMKREICKLFGDKYIKCLIDLNENLHYSFALKADIDIVADLGYSMLIQDMARQSAYFCEKSGAGGFIGVMLCTVQSYMNNLVNQTGLDYRLRVLFYCAHIKLLHYSVFGLMSALNTLNCILESSSARTRLLTRLVICCLHPIMENHHMELLKLTEEESQLLLTYIKDTNLPGGLDRAKFLMAVSVLYRDPQNALEPVARKIAETVVEQILQDCDNQVLEGALCLLWTLSRKIDIAQAISQISHLVAALKQMQQTSISAISSLAKSVLWQLGYGNYEEHAERYHCAHTCLHYGFYTECIDHCDCIIAAATTSLHGVARQVRGKAYAHLHQNQFWYVMKQGKLDVAVPWKGGDFVDQCATKAKLAVQDLGFALDQGILDKEGSYLMDISMLHFVRIKQQLRDCNRCLLCRRRGMKLKESHTWPKFLLKGTLTKAKEQLQQLGITDEVDLAPFHSIGGRFAAYTPNTMTCALLCGRCEQCLSQNGEDQFRNNILPVLYSETDETQTVKYSSNIYSFCLGIVFRSFVHNAFTVYCNASEMYSLFAECRYHLLSLPVKYSEREDVPNPPFPAEVTSTTPTEAYLFTSPYKIHIENSQLISLHASMFSNCGVWYLTTPLSTEPKTEGPFCHALVARLTCCSIVVPFSPSRGGLLDTRFRINPSGGDYQVLPDISRWETIPTGLFQVFVEFAIIFSKQYQQVQSGMKTTKKDSKKADAFIDSLTSLPKMIGISEQPITASSLQSIPVKEAEMITRFLSKSLIQVKLLPEGFDLRDYRAPPPQVILKEGYMLLYHIHDEQQGATFFFAANSEDIVFGKMIVIMKFTEESENFERIEGFNIHIREDSSNCSIFVTGNLLVPATEKLQEMQHLRHRTVSERIKEAVSILLQKCGSPKVFLQHARLQMRLKDNPRLDHRCSSTGCWYCKDRCHICMDLAIQGFTLFSSEGLMFKHCSEECKSMVDEVPCFSVQVHPAHSLNPRGVILVSIKGCLASVMSTHTIVEVHVCISMERTSIAYGRPLANVQLRTQDQHTFFSVYLSDDFSPTEPANSFPAAFTFQMLMDSGILTQIFQVSLTPLEIFSISQLLGSGGATEADSILAEAFCLSCDPCTSKLSWEKALALIESKVSQEELVSKWILDQVMIAYDDENILHQLQSSEDLSEESIPLLPSASACTTMFWACLQLTCLLWKRFLNKYNLSVEKQLTYITLVTVKLYEQSPSDIQSCIITKFCSSAHILLLCGKISVVVIKGGLPLSLHHLAVQFLLLAHKLVAAVGDASSMEYVFVRHLCQELEGVKQNDVQKTSEVSAVAQQVLLTLMLKSLSYDTTHIEAVPILLNSIKTFLKSPFFCTTVMAKAIAVILLQQSPQIGLTVSDIGITDKEVNFLVVIIHDFSQDDLKRRYYLYWVLQVLTLLCSQPINVSQFASHSILSELEMLMGCAGEYEDIIANLLWKIATGGGGENSMEVTDKSLAGEIHESEVDISLEVQQGLCNTVDKLLMIIHEFCSIYMECKHIPEPHGCIVSSAAQLLHGLHQVMERREREEVAESVSQHSTILTMLGSAISKHRESWLHIHNGICARSAIESLLVTWTACSKAISKAVIRGGILTSITNSLHWALDCTTLTASDIEGLQNQVLIIYNVAQRCPKQTAFQLHLSALQPLLCCSLPPLRVLSKSIVALIANCRDVSEITNLSLESDEAKFFSDSFSGFMESGSASVSGLHFSGEELLYSIKCLTSLPSNKNCFAVPDMLDTVSTLCLHDDITIAKLALEVLWNISMEPTVALAIHCHESMIGTLKRMSVFTTGLADLTRNILWILGYGNIADTTDCTEYAVACYQHHKYTEAVTWCNHVTKNLVGVTHRELSVVKSCKGKALAQIYLHKQNQQLQKSDQWAMLGYDNNSVVTELSTLQNLSLHPSASSSKILSKLCLADLENWRNLCSQGRQAIQLLGELLDSGELDEEGSELLDWVMMDYYRETGEVNDSDRCLLCRGTGKLVSIMPNPAASEADNQTTDYNIQLSLHSFMYVERSQSIFMFCNECEVLLSYHSEQNLGFILQTTQQQPITYGRELYLHFIAKVARALPMVYTCYFSNQRDIYNTFVACRQILLSHDMYTTTIAFPKVHLLNNPKACYYLNSQSFELNQLSHNENALIAINYLTDKGGDSQEMKFFVMHTARWNLVVDFGKAETLTAQTLIHKGGGSFPIPSADEQWATFPPELLQAFNDLGLADERKGIFQHIIKSEGKDLSAQPSPRLLSKSARFWLPQKHIISFLPEGFSMEVDSGAIRNISLPDGHKILHHCYDRDKDLTIFLAYATTSMCQEKQFYFIFTCRLCNYFIADAIFLNGDAKGPLPFSFELRSSLAIGEVTMVRKVLMQKFSPVLSVLKSLVRIIITNYGDQLKGVATYEDITRNCNLAVSVDTRCSPEGCWYCQYRCHSCLKPAAIGYTWRDSVSRKLLHHCSERCYYMYTADIPDLTLLNVKLGEIQPQPGNGAHLLVSATALLHTNLSRNTLISTQLAVSYGCKEIPSGVVYAHIKLCTSEHRTPLYAFFVQHDLSPAKHVWDVTEFQSADVATILREKAFIKMSLQPVFESDGCDDLPSFLESHFPLLETRFMNTNGTIYSWPPKRGQGSQIDTSADDLVGQRGDPTT